MVDMASVTRMKTSASAARSRANAPGAENSGATKLNEDVNAAFANMFAFMIPSEGAGAAATRSPSPAPDSPSAADAPGEKIERPREMQVTDKQKILNVRASLRSEYMKQLSKEEREDFAARIIQLGAKRFLLRKRRKVVEEKREQQYLRRQQFLEERGVSEWAVMMAEKVDKVSGFVIPVAYCITLIALAAFANS